MKANFDINQPTFQAKLQIAPSLVKEMPRLEKISNIFEKNTFKNSSDILELHESGLVFTEKSGKIEYFDFTCDGLEQLMQNSDNKVAKTLEKVFRMSKKRFQIDDVVDKFVNKIIKLTNDQTYDITFSEKNGYHPGDGYIYETIQKDSVLNKIIENWVET